MPMTDYWLFIYSVVQLLLVLLFMEVTIIRWLLVVISIDIQFNCVPAIVAV